LRFLVRLLPSSSQAFLDTVRSLAKTTGAEARNPKWTSYGALEVDIFAQTKADFELFLAAVSPLSKIQFAKDLNEAPSFKPEDELFAEAWEYFNAERYWECHEVLEGVWKTKSGDEKRLLQGIILVCAALVHHQKKEDPVALGIMARAGAQLSYPTADYHGLDLPSFRGQVKRAIEGRKVAEFRV
jgi:uncharacterized protein